MPEITRKGVDISIGHRGDGTVCIPQGNETVFVNGFPAVKVGDNFVPHPGENAGHLRSVVMGSVTVFLEDLPLVRRGDLISCGDVVGLLPTPPPDTFCEQ